ncbi:MAG: L-serine ammonia-lyase, iron-sulfur-dependent, subunit alpha [Planctomycetota bacterium]|jgi:L-cysteine desulfidase|nr:L-serine ammonia-lyase, iron-sulfur-dependent, subunit alpha [Planctomycetota bacterium]
MSEDFNAACMRILRREVVPALGCTEPVAVALASATAARDLGRLPEKIDIKTSGNIYKNGMGVMVPGTGRAGLDIAAAVGAIAGDPDLGLEVLRNVTPEAAEKGAAMLGAGQVHVSLADTTKTLYAEAVAAAGNDVARVVIEDAHARIVLRERNGNVLYRAGDDAMPPEAVDDSVWPLSLVKIWEYAKTAPAEAVEFSMETARLNAAAAEEGLKGDYGLQVGKSLTPHPNDILGDDAASFAVRFTAAGSDLRMAGAMRPVMSNSGSGNQGLACTLPVVAIARRIGAEDDTLARALLVSHLVSIHIKHFVGKLSALCGAITASTGASCGLVYLLGGDVAAMGRAIRNMSGDLAGMICDGAKYTCALKVATTTAAAIKAARLAMHDHAPGADNGIVDDDAESSILHLAQLACEGMAETDRVILDIMVKKKEKRDHAKD